MARFAFLLKGVCAFVGLLLAAPTLAQNTDEQGNPLFGGNLFRLAGVPLSAANPVPTRLSNGFAFPVTLVNPFQFIQPNLPSPWKDSLGADRVASMLWDGQHYASIKAPGVSPAALDGPLVVTLSPVPSLQCPYVVGISQTAGTKLVSGQTGRYIHICTFGVVSASAQSLSLVEGTGAVCATGTAGLYGGTAASAAMAANSGVHAISSQITIPMQKAGDDLCLLQSASGNISGTITFGVY